MLRYKSLCLVLTVFILCFSVSSCGRFEEGPGFSFRSVKNRLTEKEWVLKRIDGQQPFFFDDIVYEFDKDGTFRASGWANFNPGSATIEVDTIFNLGTWSLMPGNTRIEVFHTETIRREYDIVELRKDVFKMEELNTGVLEFLVEE